MTLPSFSSWINLQRIGTPQADLIVPLIAQAGPQGIGRGELGNAIKLDREALDELLDGLVRVGLVRMAVVDGVRVYRAV